jgi:hypothetical protein
MNSQGSTANHSERAKAEVSFEEMMANYVEYRVCIARMPAMQLSELPPAERNENVVSASSLKVQGHKSAGVGIVFKACVTKIICVRGQPSTDLRITQMVPNFPLPMITSTSPYGRAALSGNPVLEHVLSLFFPPTFHVRLK